MREVFQAGLRHSVERRRGPGNHLGISAHRPGTDCESFRWIFLPGILSLLLISSLPLAGETGSYTYGDAGRLLSVNYGGGQGISYAYDNAGNLLKRTIVRFQDTDETFIDDTREAQFFGNADRDGSEDFDGDGQTDLAEYLSGTDPTDPNSQLRVTGSSTLVGSTFTREWDAASGKSYQVQYKDNLSNSAWFNLAGEVVAPGDAATKTDPNAGAKAIPVLPRHRPSLRTRWLCAEASIEHLISEKEKNEASLGFRSFGCHVDNAWPCGWNFRRFVPRQWRYVEFWSNRRF
jgi:YD repeat-containing protein